MIERWARQQQLLKVIVELEAIDINTTVSNILNYLKQSDKTITLNQVDSSIRQYHRHGYIKRVNKFRPYSYSLSNKGFEQLAWLEDGGHLDYLIEYNRG